MTFKYDNAASSFSAMTDAIDASFDVVMYINHLTEISIRKGEV